MSDTIRVAAEFVSFLCSLEAKHEDGTPVALPSANVTEFETEECRDAVCINWKWQGQHFIVLVKEARDAGSG